MLGSFQSLYPTGSLLTELVQIYNGKYIVKASLQIEAVTRATAMAAAETLEIAEDSARQRVIAFFGSDTVLKEEQAQEPKPIQPSLSIDDSQQNQNNGTNTVNKTIDTVPAETKTPPQTTSSNIIPTTTFDNVSNGTSTQEIELPPVEEIVAPAKTKGKSKNTQDLRQSTEITPKSEQAPDIPDVHDINPVSQTTPVSEFKEPLFDTYDEFSSKEPLFEPLDTTSSTVNTPPNNVTPFTGRNYNPPEEIELPPVETPETSTNTTSTGTTKRKKKAETTDQSDDIAKIGIEMQRLGWTTEQGRDYLIKQYNKRSRHLLSAEELRDFRQYLESQSTPDDPLAFDPIAGF